jgi:hypothetical protein
MNELTTITLDTPLTRGEHTIDTVTLRKPQVSALRGTSLAALANLDINALQCVLPRITTPTLTEAEIAQLDPADLMQLGGAFAHFLLPKALMADSPIISKTS